MSPGGAPIGLGIGSPRPLSAEHGQPVQMTSVDAANETPTLRTVAPGMYTVKGWVDLEDAETLFRAAAVAETGCIVEIGSHRGRCTLREL